MRRVFPRLLALMAVMAAGGGVDASHAGERPSNHRSARGIDVVSLNVTVADGSRPVRHRSRRRRVLGLRGRHEAGGHVLQSLEPADRVVAAARHQREHGRQADRRRRTPPSASSSKLRPQDFGQVIDFDSRVSIAQPFTSNVPDLEPAIRKTIAGGSTSLHNAIYIALKELKKIQARSADDVRRQAIVVLSDGEDTSSLVGFDEVLELAKRSETAIYAIGLRGRGPDHVRGSFNEADFVLRQLAQETGGRVFFARTATELTGIYEQISDELSSQYMLGYQLEEPQTRRRLAPHRRARQRAGRDRTHEAGVLRADLVVGSYAQSHRHGERRSRRTQPMSLRAHARTRNHFARILAAYRHLRMFRPYAAANGLSDRRGAGRSRAHHRARAGVPRDGRRRPLRPSRPPGAPSPRAGAAPSASTSAPPRPTRRLRKPSAICWSRRPAKAGSSHASNGATRSSSIAAAKKRCSFTSRACRSRSCPESPRRSAFPAIRGVPLTYPGGGDTVTLVRGHEDESQTAPAVDWASLAKLKGTIVCYTGTKQLPAILDALISHGMSQERNRPRSSTKARSRASRPSKARWASWPS